MSEIQYRIVYAGGDEEFVTVRARSVNVGFATALRRAREPLGNGTERQIDSVEFWELVS